MMNYARIENDEIVGRRSFAVTPDPNPAKGLDWRKVPDEPSYDREYERLDLQPTAAGVEWVATLLPVDDKRSELKTRIKSDAMTKILAIVPDWKQRNLLAQAMMLMKKGEANWDTADRQAWNDGEAVWNRIKALRDASDVGETSVDGGVDAKAAHDSYKAVGWPE